MLMNCMLEDTSDRIEYFRCQHIWFFCCIRGELWQCSYIKMVDEEGRIHCSLLLGKSRVVQKRFVSIPRLELTAAVLSVKMSCLLKKELNLGEVNHYFWTDSKVVLGYIRNETRRFKTFVTNRIYQIKSNANAEQQSYISTRENPTDDASRGLNTEWQNSNCRWF